MSIDIVSDKVKTNSIVPIYQESDSFIWDGNTGTTNYSASCIGVVNFATAATGNVNLGPTAGTVSSASINIATSTKLTGNIVIGSPDVGATGKLKLQTKIAECQAPPTTADGIVNRTYALGLITALKAAINDWTGTNTFNTNLPTSTLTPTTSFMMTTKGYVDTAVNTVLLALDNVWTGASNTFNLIIYNSDLRSLTSTTDMYIGQNLISPARLFIGAIGTRFYMYGTSMLFYNNNTDFGYGQQLANETTTSSCKHNFYSDTATSVVSSQIVATGGSGAILNTGNISVNAGLISLNSGDFNYIKNNLATIIGTNPSSYVNSTGSLSGYGTRIYNGSTYSVIDMYSSNLTNALASSRIFSNGGTTAIGSGTLYIESGAINLTSNNSITNIKGSNNAYFEMGAGGNNCLIDFHSYNGVAADYDARIMCNGANGVAGGGIMETSARQIKLTAAQNVVLTGTNITSNGGPHTMNNGLAFGKGNLTSGFFIQTGGFGNDSTVYPAFYFTKFSATWAAMGLSNFGTAPTVICNNTTDSNSPGMFLMVNWLSSTTTTCTFMVFNFQSTAITCSIRISFIAIGGY